MSVVDDNESSEFCFDTCATEKRRSEMTVMNDVNVIGIIIMVTEIEKHQRLSLCHVSIS